MTNAPVPQSPQNQPAESPMMGLFLDRPAHMIDPKGLSACNNVRIELGRVRSDLIGWSALTNTGTLAFNGPIIWIDAIVNDVHSQILAVTPTDIFGLIFAVPNDYSLIYVTPTYITGLASVNNGSTSVAGTGGTHWSGDITGGTQDFFLNAAASVGATSIAVNVSSSNEYFLNVLPGMPIEDLTSPGSIPSGTYIASVAESVGSCTLALSQAIQIAIPITDTIMLGSGQSVRANVRAGDQIAFGSTNPNAPGLTWYTVASVSPDGTGASAGTSTLTLTTPYVGTNLSGVSYVIRECLTDTTKQSPAYLPECSSDNLQFPSGFTGSANPCNVAWFFTNGIDPVYVFFNDLQGASGSNPTMYARSIPFTCASLKQVRGIMVYGSLTFGGGILAGGTTLGSSIASSDDNLPLQLNSGIAFQGIATSGPFTIVRMAILGSTLLLYSRGTYSGGTVSDNDKAGSVTSATFVGFPTIWSFSDIIQTRGPSSGGAVAVFADHHEFLSLDGQYRYNGLFIQVMNDHIWRTVMKNFDFTRQSSAFAAIIPTFGDVLWAIPQLTDPANQLYASSAYVEHYMEQANSYLFKPYTVRDFPFTASGSLQNVNISAGPSDITNQPLYIAGDIHGNVWQLYASNFQNGSPPLCTATWAPRKIGNGRARMLVTRVYPELEYQASPVSPVDVTLTLQNYAAGPVTITDTQDFDLSYGGGVGWTTHFRRGAVASVTLSDQAGVGWICDGYDWDYTAGGVRLKA